MKSEADENEIVREGNAGIDGPDKVNPPGGEEDIGKVMAGHKKGSWITLNGVLSALVFIMIFLLITVPLLGGGVNTQSGQNIELEIKGTGGLGDKNDLSGRARYELDPFFIPLEGGRGFIKLKVSLVDFPAGLERRIEESPYKYREAVLNIFDRKKLNNIGMAAGKRNVQEEIESSFKTIAGDKTIGKVLINSFDII